MAGGGTSGFGPGLWVVDIEKMHTGEYWTNRYIVAAADLAAAHTIAMSIYGLERQIHFTSVLFNKVRTSDGIKDTDVYQVQNPNTFGMLTQSADILTLFNVVRVDFTTAGGGRPSRKYLRGCLGESQVSYNTIDNGTLSNIAASYANPLAALAGFVDVDGQEITAASVYPYVGMRQLRRGSKRKALVTSTPAT